MTFCDTPAGIEARFQTDGEKRQREGKADMVVEIVIYCIRANKGRGFYSKIISSVQYNGTFLPNFVYF